MIGDIRAAIAFFRMLRRFRRTGFEGRLVVELKAVPDESF